MFLGHSNFSSWLTTKLLTAYGRKRFKINDPEQRHAYISAHQNSETGEWIKPTDLTRVSLTNLSQYNTEYSVLKYLLETELDVLQQPPYNQLTVYTEIIENTSPDTFTKAIDDDTFLVGIHSGRIQQIANLLLTTDVVPKILEPLTRLTKINETFLKTFAMELAVKATIYAEFANIFNQHATLKNSQQTPNQSMPEKYKNDLLVGDFLTKEIQSRTHLMLESSFFDEDKDEDVLRNEMQQLCIASLYVYYAQQRQENDQLAAEERVFCTFTSLTENHPNITQQMLDTMQATQSIIEAASIESSEPDVFQQHDKFRQTMQA